MLIVSVRDTATEGYRQIHRIGPDVVDFKGETAREERKKLLLHRLFENRAQFSASAIAHVVKAYDDERIRLLLPPAIADTATADNASRTKIATEILPPMLRRELQHRGPLPENSSLALKLLAWVEISGVSR